MKEYGYKYLKILGIELDDLRDDIEALEERNVIRQYSRAITERVCLENLAVLNNEILGVGILHKILRETDPGAYEALDELVGYLDGRFAAEIQKHGLHDAVMVFVRRKMHKVQKYMAHCD